MGDNNISTEEESREDSRLGSGRVVVASSAHALLDSLLLSAQKVEASSVHFYSSPKSKSCYLEIAGKLEPTGKKFNDRVLAELIDFVKESANLEKSELVQFQTGSLEVGQPLPLTLTLINSTESKNSHLILNLDTATKPKSFEDLGLWGKALEQLEAVLDYGKGVIIVDSLDQYALRSFINSSLSYIKQSRKVTSVSFDSSWIPDTDLRNHDRIFTRLNLETSSLSAQVLSTNPSAAAFMDSFNEATLDAALEYCSLGGLVFLSSSEGSVARSVKKLLSVSTKAFQEVDLVISIAPIQTIKTSNGSHEMSLEVISQIENFFGLDLPESWRSIYTHAGIRTPEELLQLNFPVASDYSGLTNLVEIFIPSEDVRRSVIRNPDLSTPTLHLLAIRSGMITKREDGLVKALRKEVDLADVIDTCK